MPTSWPQCCSDLATVSNKSAKTGSKKRIPADIQPDGNCKRQYRT